MRFHSTRQLSTRRLSFTKKKLFRQFNLQNVRWWCLKMFSMEVKIFERWWTNWEWTWRVYSEFSFRILFPAFIFTSTRIILCSGKKIYESSWNCTELLIELPPDFSSLLHRYCCVRYDDSLFIVVNLLVSCMNSAGKYYVEIKRFQLLFKFFIQERSLSRFSHFFGLLDNTFEEFVFISVYIVSNSREIYERGLLSYENVGVLQL